MKNNNKQNDIDLYVIFGRPERCGACKASIYRCCQYHYNVGITEIKKSASTKKPIKKIMVGKHGSATAQVIINLARELGDNKGYIPGGCDRAYTRAVNEIIEAIKERYEI